MAGRAMHLECYLVAQSASHVFNEPTGVGQALSRRCDVPLTRQALPGMVAAQDNFQPATSFDNGLL